MIPGSSNPLMMAAAPAGDYQIERSLRFNSSDSAYLSRTPAVAGNRRTWTWAGWVKRSGLGSDGFVLFSRQNANNDASTFYVGFVQDRLVAATYNGRWFETSQIFRDPSAYCHIVIVLDTTQAIASDRLKAYVNGLLVTQYAADGRGGISQNADLPWNDAALSEIGRLSAAVTGYFSGYLADVHFIDGQALTPSSFTEVSATTGQLIPKTYSGTYGTNGFQLKFADNSSNTAATLGKDTSGNSNNWTPNSLNVTAGVGNDSLVDTPTSFGTDTYVGGEVRGNYCTWNPLATGNLTAVNGNLGVKPASSDWQQIKGTISVSTGKWYWESTVNPSSTYINQYHGISNYLESPNTNLGTVTGFCYGHSGDKYYAGTYQSGVAASYTFGDVIGMALDLDSATQTIKFYKNGTLQFTQTITGTGPWHPASNCYYVQTPTVFDTNFGQRAFAHPVSGFKALCDTNLGAPLVAKPNTVMDVVTRAGGGTTQTFATLRPGLVWEKRRDSTSSHYLFDVNRGNDKHLSSDTTSAEGSTAGAFTFNTNSYTVSSGFDWPGGATVVDWVWDAGGTTDPSNTAGSITSQVRANASAGFSVVTYTGNGSSGATVGHGLGVAPQMIILKGRAGTTAANHWFVWHTSLSSGYNINLNLTNAQRDTSAFLSGIVAAPSNSTTFGFTAGSSGIINVNETSTTYVAYCFAAVVGYSSFGSYTGNGSADGPFVYTGFRPRFILTKATNSALDWNIFDAARDSYNSVNKVLFPNLSNAESNYIAYTPFDFLSNGFKLRTSIVWNASSTTYIYAAFAESPFQYARAR